MLSALSSSSAIGRDDHVIHVLGWSGIKDCQKLTTRCIGASVNAIQGHTHEA